MTGPAASLEEAAAELAEALSQETAGRIPVAAASALSWSRLHETDALVLGSGAGNQCVFELQRRGLAVGPGRLAEGEFFARTLYDPLETGANVVLVEAKGPAGWRRAIDALAHHTRDGILAGDVWGRAAGLPARSPSLRQADQLVDQLEGDPSRTVNAAVGAGLVYYWTAQAAWADLAVRLLERLTLTEAPCLEALAPWLAAALDALGWLEFCEAVEDHRIETVRRWMWGLGRPLAELVHPGRRDGTSPAGAAGAVLALVRMTRSRRPMEGTSRHEAADWRTSALAAHTCTVNAWLDERTSPLADPVAWWLTGLASLATCHLEYFESGLARRAAEMAMVVHAPDWSPTIGNATDGPMETACRRAALEGVLAQAAWFQRDAQYQWAADEIRRGAAQLARAPWPAPLVEPVWTLGRWSDPGTDLEGQPPEPDQCRLLAFGQRDDADGSIGIEKDTHCHVMLRGKPTRTGEYLLQDLSGGRVGPTFRFVDGGQAWIAETAVRIGCGAEDESDGPLPEAVCQRVERVIDLPKLTLLRFSGGAAPNGGPALGWTRTILWYKGQFMLFLDELAPGEACAGRLELEWDLVADGSWRAGRWISTVANQQLVIVPMGLDGAHEIAPEHDGGGVRLVQQWRWPAAAGRNGTSWLAANLVLVRGADRPKRWVLRQAGPTGVAVVGKNERAFVVLDGPKEEEFTSDAKLCYVDAQEVVLADFSEVRLGDFHLRSYHPLSVVMNLRDGAGEIRATESTTMHVSADEPAGVSLDGQIIWARQGEPGQAVVLSAGLHTFAARSLVGRKVRLAEGLQRPSRATPAEVKKDLPWVR